MKIFIDKSITEILPSFNVLAFSMDIEIKDSSVIEELIKKTEKRIFEEYTLEDVISIPLIKEARDAYKALGKDPSRYRLACESLLRRIVKGNSLYRINNVVDAGNILSIDTKRSVCVVDSDKVIGNVNIRLGKEEDIYEGIGRGIIKVNNIPLYDDNVGPFGSPTSDTPRTMITDNTKKILLMIICFSSSEVEENINRAVEIFTEYAIATSIEKIEVIRK